MRSTLSPMIKVELPQSMRSLPLDSRGFPVPWFVQWFGDDGQPTAFGKGKPDFRCVDARKVGIAVVERRCWICGGKLGRWLAFAVGPMCVVTRTTSEPPSHRACAEFAAMACPFLTQPKMRRNEVERHPDRIEAPGMHLEHNPGATAIYMATSFTPFRADGGYLYRMGDPASVEWYASGRRATRAEIVDALGKGLPFLRGIARQDGDEAELDKMLAEAMKLLPEEART